MSVIPISKVRRLERLEAKPPDDSLGLPKPIECMTPEEKIQFLRDYEAEHGEDIELKKWIKTLTPTEHVAALLKLREIINDPRMPIWRKLAEADALMAKPGTAHIEEK